MNSDSVNTNGKSGGGAVATPTATLAAQPSSFMSAAARTPHLSTALPVEGSSGLSAAQLAAASAHNGVSAGVTARAPSLSKPAPTAAAGAAAATVPAKRKRPSARASASSADARHRALSPFSVLELLTNGFDGALVLREAAQAGFHVPLLDAVDNARIKHALHSNVAGEAQPRVLHMYSNSRGQLGVLSPASSDSDNSEEERAAAAAAAARTKPKRRHKRAALQPQPGTTSTLQADTGGKATDQPPAATPTAAGATTATAATAKRKAPSSSTGAPSKKSGRPRKDGQLAPSTVASGAAVAAGATSTDDLTATTQPAKSPTSGTVHRSIQSVHGAAANVAARSASPAPSAIAAATKKSQAAHALKSDDNWMPNARVERVSDEAKQSALSSRTTASAPPVPLAAAAVAAFPFTHLNADSIRFRKADLQPADLSKWRKQRALQRRREQLLQQEEDEAEAAAAAAAASAEGRSDSRSGAAAAASGATSDVDADGDSAMSDSHAAAAAALPTPTVTSEAQRLRREQEQAMAAAAAEAAAREAAIQAATAGMTARQARYLYTNLTPTNIIPEGRRRRPVPRHGEMEYKEPASAAKPG